MLSARSCLRLDHAQLDPVQHQHLIAIHDLLYCSIICKQATVPYNNRHGGGSVGRTDSLHSPHNVHPSEHTAHDHMLAVEVGSRSEQDVELQEQESGDPLS